MAEPKLIYRCQQCGYVSPKWMGKCPECQIWHSFSEEVAPGGARKLASKLAKTLSTHPVSLDEIQSDGEVRFHTGIGEWDRVLGGGSDKGIYRFARGRSRHRKIHPSSPGPFQDDQGRPCSLCFRRREPSAVEIPRSEARTQLTATCSSFPKPHWKPCSTKSRRTRRWS